MFKDIDGFRWWLKVVAWQSVIIFIVWAAYPTWVAAESLVDGAIRIESLEEDKPPPCLQQYICLTSVTYKPTIGYVPSSELDRGLVLFTEAPSEAQINILKQHGVSLVHQVPHKAWYAQFSNGSSDVLELDFVSWVGELQPVDRISYELNSLSKPFSSLQMPINVRLWPDSGRDWLDDFNKVDSSSDDAYIIYADWDDVDTLSNRDEIMWLDAVQIPTAVQVDSIISEHGMSMATPIILLITITLMCVTVKTPFLLKD